MSVRVWWLCAIGLLVVTLYVVGMEAARALADRALVQKEVKVDAIIYEINNISRPNFSARPDENAEFAMRFTLPDGKTHSVRGKLKAQRDTLAVSKEKPIP